MRIPPTKPHFSPRSIEFILDHFREILEGKSFLSSFKHCEEFERRFADHHGAKHAATCSSGTTALELCLRGLKIENKEVIVPSVTFAATAYAVISSGCRPVFAESDDDFSVDPADVERCFTPQTGAVVTVHIGGRVSPHTARLVDLCRRKGVPLIEDAAHAHGSALAKKKAGTFGQAAAFSFFSTKVMTTGEGGMVLTDDETVRDRCRLIRDYAKAGGRNYHEEYGSSWRMTEVQALMGLTQLDELDSFIERRQQLAAIFDEYLQAEEGLEVVPSPAECSQNFYKYLVLPPPQVPRDIFTKQLKEQHGVSLGGPVYELALHEQPVFQSYVTRELPKAGDLCRRHICPPMYFTMTDEEAHYTASAVRDTFRSLIGREAAAPDPSSVRQG